jgi:ubiquinone/menaquinone biosynthesis C-methylase UbiE
MTKNTETLESWNKVADLYNEKFTDLQLYNHTYDLFIEQLPCVDSKILDIACGPGNISKYLLSRDPNLQILGIDVSPNMLSLAKINNPSAQFILMDCRDILKIDSTKFDGIICGFGIPYLSSNETKKLIEDCVNLLTKDGVVYISFVEGNSLDSNYVIGSTGHRMFFNYHQLDDLRIYFDSANSAIIDITKVEYKNASNQTEIHTIIIAKKL